jgi:hypothetical protein
VGLPFSITCRVTAKLCVLRSKVMGVPGCFIAGADVVVGVVFTVLLATMELTAALPLAVVELTIAVPLNCEGVLYAEWASAWGASALLSGSKIGLRNSFGASASSLTGLLASNFTRSTLTVPPFLDALNIPSFMLIGGLPATSLGWSGT